MDYFEEEEVDIKPKLNKGPTNESKGKGSRGYM